MEATTQNFEGLVVMLNPEKSWVARWQHIDGRDARGCYALSTTGALPAHLISLVREQGLPYPRNK